MSATYTTIGQALYDLFSGIDITAMYPGGWAIKANYPLKEPARLTDLAGLRRRADGTVNLGFGVSGMRYLRHER